jgi:AraC-like DNA-binding protein/mannose-6-phosphate isomerase-like protein (cupin superfamily)
VSTDIRGVTVQILHPGAAGVKADCKNFESFSTAVTRAFPPISLPESASQPHRGKVDAPSIPFNVGAQSSEGFTAHIEAYLVNSTIVSLVKAPAHHIEFNGYAAVEKSALKIYYILEGSAVVIQNGREITVTAGQLTVHDTSAPYQIWTETGFRALIVMVPTSRMYGIGVDIHNLRTLRFTEGQGAGRIVLPYLGGLSKGMDEMVRGHGPQVVQTCIDLLRMMFTVELGIASDKENSHRMRQREQIEGWIRSHLMDEDLSPRRIAAENFISTRTLHAIFEESKATVGTFVRSSRLALACELLVTRVDLPVVEVARLAGFLDPSYFSRLFKAEYGCTPGKYRTRANSSALSA